MESFGWVFDAFEADEIFTAFDTETTGLDSRRDRIVEIGAVKFNRRGELERYSSLVNPGIPMPAGAGKVNNITDAMLDGQPFIQEVLPAFLRFAAGTVVLAHNAPFDCGFVNSSLSRLYDDGYADSPFLSNRVADTLIMARRILPGRGRYNLQDITASLGFRAESAHRALDDARLCMELFICLARKENCSPKEYL